MTKNTVLIRVNVNDLNDMRTSCKELFLKENPMYDVNTSRITDRFLFNRLVRYYKK